MRRNSFGDQSIISVQCLDVPIVFNPLKNRVGQTEFLTLKQEWDGWQGEEPGGKHDGGFPGMIYRIAKFGQLAAGVVISKCHRERRAITGLVVERPEISQLLGS